MCLVQPGVILDWPGSVAGTGGDVVQARLGLKARVDHHWSHLLTGVLPQAQ